MSLSGFLYLQRIDELIGDSQAVTENITIKSILTSDRKYRK